jgi:hypothetical protein
MDVDLYPHLTQFPENRLALERERRLRRQLRAARAARRVERSFGVEALTARLRGALRPAQRPPLVEGC